MKFGIIHFLCILIIIFVLIYYYYHLQQHQQVIQEGARTLPKPTRHPILHIYDDSEYPMRNAVLRKNINEWIDQIIARYFDENDVPYENTINTYVSRFADQGNITEINKAKMEDICYYLLNYVIPNIPSEKNPTPTLVWPKIQWLSKMTDIKGHYYNASGIAELTSSYWENNSEDKSLNYSGSGYDYGEGSIDLGKSGKLGSSGNAGRSGSGGVNGGGGGSGSCNRCPSSCLSNISNGLDAIAAKNAKKKESGTEDTWTSDDINAFDYDKWNLCQINKRKKHQTTTTLFTKNVAGYQVTDISNTDMSPNSPLNQFIDTTIKTYFNQSGEPTVYALAQFQGFVDHYSLIDDLHKNKLRDLVYYFMEMIIPGLPTSAIPRSYVEWKPIRWLSHSSV